MFDENFLDEELKRNNSAEISKIIHSINSKQYTDYLELSCELRRLVQEFDPFEKENVIDYIFKNLLPVHRDMFKPVNIVMREEGRLHRRRPRLLFGCFSQT
jgi:hypothetical protein